MRGKVQHERACRLRRRITPAYAGKSSTIFRKAPEKKDHPRLCGEKLYCFTTAEKPSGSPPPMRGKVIQNLPAILQARITPAYAGKSSRKSSLVIVEWDHPRLCGEKLYRSDQAHYSTGSPPPMRGKAEKYARDSIATRITPAYAGKSPVPAMCGSPAEDHPRLCGEKLYRPCVK